MTSRTTMTTLLRQDSQVKVHIIKDWWNYLSIVEHRLTIHAFLFREEATQTLYQQQIADPAAAAGVVLHDSEVN